MISFMDKKTHQIAFKVSYETLITLQSLADIEGRSLSSFIRLKLIDICNESLSEIESPEESFLKKEKKIKELASKI